PACASSASAGTASAAHCKSYDAPGWSQWKNGRASHQSSRCASWIRACTHKSASVSGSVNVRFAPKATEVLHCRELTRCAISDINAVRRQVRVRVPCDGGGERLHFHGVPEEVNASIPASAHSKSCSSVAPATPTAPSTWPARMTGRPPGRLISGAPSPMTVAARKYSAPSLDLSRPWRPALAESHHVP